MDINAFFGKSNGHNFIEIKDKKQLQPRFDDLGKPFHFTGSITAVNSSLVSEACLFAEQADCIFKESAGELGRSFTNLPFGERFLLLDKVLNYNPMNLLSFVLLLEACVFYDHVVVFGGSDPYDILSHNLLYNRAFDLCQFLIDERILFLVGDYNYHQLTNSNAPRSPDPALRFPSDRQLVRAYDSSNFSSVLLRSQGDDSSLRKSIMNVEDTQWSFYGAFTFLLTMSLFSVPITINPQWLPSIHYLSAVHDKTKISLIKPFIRKLNNLFGKRIADANEFSRNFGGWSRIAIPPVAGIVLDRVARGECLTSALMKTRGQFSKLRKRYYERQQVLSDSEASISDVEKVKRALITDIDRIRKEFSPGKQLESWLIEEWRAVPDAVSDVAKIASSVQNPRALIDMLIRKMQQNIDAIEKWYKFRHLRQVTKISRRFLNSTLCQKGLAKITRISPDQQFVFRINHALSLLQDRKLLNRNAFIQLVGEDRCDCLIHFDHEHLTEEDRNYLASLKRFGWN